MKKAVKTTGLVLLLIVAGIFIYWQFIKKRVIRNVLENAVSAQTDNQYYIHYDSSSIDEVNGNASFFNIVLQSDSMQEKLYTNDTSVDASIFNVRVEQLKISGANIPSFLQKNTIEARRIDIIRPVLTIISTGKEEKIHLSAKDSLALYDRITGKFKSIQADEINIVNASIAFAKGKKAPSTTFQDVDIQLKNFKIDSTRNYDNIVSYFIKDIVATVKSVTTKDDKTGDLLVFEGIEYNAPNRLLKLNRVLKKNEKSTAASLELRNNRITGISTNEFIVNRKIKADSLITDGGAITLYTNKRKAVNRAEGDQQSGTEITLDNGFFDEALIKNIKLGKTMLMLHNRVKPNDEPLVVKNMQFTAFNIANIYNGTDIMQLIGNSNWNLAADGLSLLTKDKLYRLIVGPFILDNARSAIHVNQVSLVPTMTPQQYVKTLKVQKDLYNFRFNNIDITGADIHKLLTDNELIAEELTTQPLLSISNDRTVPYDPSSKIGKYPQQQLVKFDFPVYIKKVNLKNGNVLYRERGALSKQTGDVFFSDINATVTNVTNIKSRIAANSNMQLIANTKFLGIANVTTTWNLSLSSTNGEFSASGTAGAFDASKLSAITEPLGIASIKRGNIKKLDFSLKGTNTKATGKETLLYDNLKISLLKGNKDSTANLQKKSLISVVANIFVKDQNPSNGVTRSVKIDYDRDISKSFFYLLWKSVFVGAKKIASGKNDL